LPGHERVGLLGTSYLVETFGDEGWFGPAVYGAVTGRRGGFFTYGVEAAWRRRLHGPLAVELGLYAGAGGGGGAPQGGGLMLRPHADLLWDRGPYALGLSLSNVRFPNGRIASTQAGLVLEVASDFAFVPAQRLAAGAGSHGRSGIGFDRFAGVATEYRVRGERKLDGSMAPGRVELLGMRVEQALGGDAYWGLEANGAARAGVAGYAEYLASFALETAPADRVRVGARVALGVGGGGGLSVGGGLLAKAAVYGVVPIGQRFGVVLEAGAVTAPRGDLRAASGSVALVWALEPTAASDGATPAARTDFGVAVERFRAARRDGGTRAVTAEVLKVDRFVQPNLYLSGQVHSAVAGDAGGYSAALLGVGWRQPLTSRFHWGAEILAGAAGGGGVDSRGSVVQPNLYAGFQLTPALALRAGIGWVGSPGGSVRSPLVDLGVAMTYGVSGP
jgi:hypothetical protein